MWLREWFRDEKFWRDVASRAIAGLIVTSTTALIGLAWLAATGLVPRINWMAVLDATGWVALILGLFLGVGVNGAMMSAPSREAFRSLRKEFRQSIVTSVVLMAYGGATLYFTGALKAAEPFLKKLGLG